MFRVRAASVVLALSALTALSASADPRPASVGPVTRRGLAPVAQSPETAWIIWETETPIQRLALHNDSLWAGAYKGGLFRWDLERGPQSHFTTQDGLPGMDVVSLAVDDAGGLWVAALDGGVARSSDGSSFDKVNVPPLAGSNPWDFTTRGGEVWLASLGGGVSQRSGAGWTNHTSAHGLPHDDVYAVALAPDGTPWIGTIGYSVATRKGNAWITYDLPVEIPNPVVPGGMIPNDAVTDIEIDGAGNVWFATDGSGIVLREAGAESWTVFDRSNSGLASDFVQAIEIDPEGNLWFGTLGGGVSELSADRASWLTYNVSNSPLSEDDILDVAVDARGGLWLASYDAGLTFYGALPDTPPVFDLDPRGQPTYLPGKAKGYYLWLDPATYDWTLAWSGDGHPRAFSGEILTDGGSITLLEAADLEEGDIASAEGGRLAIEAEETAGQDSIRFALDRGAAELTVRLQIDGAFVPFSMHVGALGASPGTAPFRINTPQPEAPVVLAGEDQLVQEGDLVFFRGSFSDADSPVGHQIAWNLGDGTTVEGTLSPNHVYADNGDYPVSLTVTDVHGEVGSDTMAVAVENVPPQVDFSFEPFLPVAGQPVAFSAFLYDPGEKDTHTLEWNFGDETPIVTTSDLVTEHTYSAPGMFTARLTATDDDGGVGSAELLVNVTAANVAPTVEAGADTAMNEGDALSRSVSFTDPGSVSWTVTIDYGDGSQVQELALTLEGAFDLSHVYVDNGMYSVVVTVKDEGGATGNDSFTVTVENLAPVVDTGSKVRLKEGDALTRAGSFLDPGADTWSATVDYGDGSGSQTLDLDGKTFNLNHKYQDNGVFTLVVTVTDDDGGVGAASLAVTVENVAPLVDAGSDVTLDEGGTLSRTGSFTDPGTDTWSATVDYGDGSGDQALPLDGKSFTLNHIYVENGVYTVHVTVVDEDGGQGDGTFVLTVKNVAPTVEAGPDVTISSGAMVEVHASFSDPGVRDTHTATIDFGLGAGAQPATVSEEGGSGHVTGSQQYLATGSYTATVCVTDDDGDIGCDSLAVQVKPISVAIDIKPGSDTNPINLCEKGKVPVAILGSPGFNAKEIDPASVRFAGAPIAAKPNGKLQYSFEDSNGDGVLDMLAHFEAQSLDLDEADTEATLAGSTFARWLFAGTDKVTILAKDCGGKPPGLMPRRDASMPPGFGSRSARVGLLNEGRTQPSQAVPR